MSLRRHLLRPVLLAGLAGCLPAFPAAVSVAQAQETAAAAEPSPEAVRRLAGDFMKKIGGGFARADKYMDNIRPDRQNFAIEIPDGETLLLQPKIRDTVIDSLVPSIKQGPDVFIALSDFFLAADFAIRTDADAGTATGWFIRENQEFYLDAKSGTARVRGAPVEVDRARVKLQDGEIYVAATQLGRWLGMSLSPDFMRQFLVVESEQKWPIEERLARKGRGAPDKTRRAPPSLPRQEDEYDIVSVPNVDVRLNQLYRKRGNGSSATTRTNAYVTAQGDLAGMTARTSVTANNEESIQGVRFTVGKQDEDPGLLGPLKARSFQAGDVDPVRMPLTGSSQQELGFHVTNRESGILSRQDTTIFRGEAPPNWDVELYRNDSFVGFTTVDETGRYAFDDVELFAGNNDFRLLFFGTQGEIREERRSFFIDPKVTNSRDGVYDVSLSLSETQTYEAEPGDEPERGKPHIAAYYEEALSSDLTVGGGIRVRQEGEMDKTYLTAGATTNFRGALVDVDAAYDVDGAGAVQITGRRNLGQHKLRTALMLATDEFSPGRPQDDPEVINFSTSAQGPAPIEIGQRPVYNLTSEYSETSEGETSNTNTAGLSTRFGRFLANTTISHRMTDGIAGKEEKIYGAISGRGSIGATGVRGGINYDISPDALVRQYLINLSRQITEKTDAEFEVTHAPEESFSEARLGMNWRGKHATISPRIEANTEKDIRATLGVRFGTAYDPYGGDFLVRGGSYSGKGGVSAFVFLDKNGDKVFSEGDMPISEAKVNALHASRHAYTDESGVAFIYDIPEGRLTDVMVDQASFEDPYWIPVFEGVSLRVRPGHVSRIEYPVQVAGEIDGTVYALSQDGESARPAKGIKVHMYDSDGRLHKTTVSGYDGFYLFPQVPPGLYYIAVDKADAAAAKAVSGPPQPVTFAYDGTIIYGNNLYMGSRDDVGFDLVANYADRIVGFDEAAAGEKLTGGDVLLNLGSYNSQLLMTVMWYRLNERYGAILGGADILMAPQESYASFDTGLHTLRAVVRGGGMAEAARKCRALKARDIYCSVEFSPAMPRQAATLAPAESVSAIYR